MTTVPGAAPTQNNGNTSKAISAGADVLISMFEEEKIRITEASLLSYRTLETQFAVYRMQTEQMMQQFHALQGRYDAVCLELQQARLSSQSQMNADRENGHSHSDGPANGQISLPLEEHIQARKAAETERDHIKAAVAGEITALKEQVSALQMEIAALRNAGQPGQLGG